MMKKYKLMSPYGTAPYVDAKGENIPRLNELYDTLDEACRAADSLTRYGYVVYDTDGEFAYNPCVSLSAAKILYHAKINADCMRDNGYTYGDASANPALDKTEKIASCDRYAAWSLYDAGVNTNGQPKTKGYTLHIANNFEQMLIQQGFTKITDITQVEAGDVIFTGYSYALPIPEEWKSVPKHTFICAGKASIRRYYRYDAGSDKRLQSTQPSCEILSYSNNVFRYAYRAPKEFK